MKSIILTGFMGSGKTTIGKIISSMTGTEFVDMDDEIVKREGRSINDIFRDNGESYFRDLETGLLKEYAEENKNVVLSTGGGAVLRDENVAYLKSFGKIFFLKTETDELVRRLMDDTSRPLLKDAGSDGLKKKIEDMMTQRMPKYERAYEVVIDTNGKSAEAIADEIINHMNK